MSLRRRISRLEAAVPPHSEVMGVRIDDGPVKVQGEEMSLEEFKVTYPNANPDRQSPTR